VRRAFAAIEEEAGAGWLRGHLDHCMEPLLSEPWILDVDTTVKPLYGRQEGAWSGTIRESPGDRAIAITPIRWRAHDWCLMWMCARATNMRPIMPRRRCGRCWIE